MIRQVCPGPGVQPACGLLPALPAGGWFQGHRAQLCPRPPPLPQPCSLQVMGSHVLVTEVYPTVRGPGAATRSPDCTEMLCGAGLPPTLPPALTDGRALVPAHPRGLPYSPHTESHCRAFAVTPWPWHLGRGPERTRAEADRWVPSGLRAVQEAGPCHRPAADHAWPRRLTAAFGFPANAGSREEAPARPGPHPSPQPPAGQCSVPRAGGREGSRSCWPSPGCSYPAAPGDARGHP